METQGIESVEAQKTIVLGDEDFASVIEFEDESSLLESLPVKPRRDRYRFIRSIGFGGMKAVLLVEDRDTGREVAMAMMPDFRERSRKDLTRFVSEARITAGLEHPGIIPVHDIGIDASGSPYFTMKYLRGRLLEKLISHLRDGDPATVGKYTLFRRLQIFIRVCNAVDFAHSRGICHLDIKPGNIDIGDFGEVVVLDWGLARHVDNSGRAKLDELRPKGTPGYIAPEYLDPASAAKVGTCSDIYSLGGVLYALLALKPPLSGFEREDVLKRTASGRIPPPSMAAPEQEIPAALDAVCMKAMARNPEDRYRSVKELRKEINAYMAGFAPQAEHAGVLRHAELFMARNIMPVLLLTSAVLIAILLIIIWRGM